MVGWEDGSGHWRGKRLSEKLTDDFPSIRVRGGDVVGLVQTAIHRIHPDLRIHVGARGARHVGAPANWADALVDLIVLRARRIYLRVRDIRAVYDIVVLRVAGRAHAPNGHLLERRACSMGDPGGGEG